MKEYDLFISYSVKDSDIAQRLVECLEDYGLRCWIAPRNIMHGGMWAEEIVEAIKNAKAFVLIYSKNSHDSSQVPKEVGLATSGRKRIFPFCIDDTPLDRAFLYHLSDCQMIQAQTDRERRMEELAQVLARLMESGGSEEGREPEENGEPEENLKPEKSRKSEGSKRPKGSRKPEKFRKQERVRKAENCRPGKKKLRLGVYCVLALIVFGGLVKMLSDRDIVIAGRTFSKDASMVLIGEGAGPDYKDGSMDIQISEQDLKNLCRMDELRVLDIKSVAVDGTALQTIARLSGLGILILEDVGLSNEDIQTIAQMSGLRELSIADNAEVTDIAPLAGLQGLDILDISGTGISDGGVLQDLESVRSLYMNRLEKLDGGMIALPKGLHSLECSFCGMESLDFLRTTELSEITSICAAGNRISDIGIIGDCYSLETLDLSDNRITDVSVLADNFSIRTLDISQNQIKDISAIAGMEALKNFDITANEIEDISPLADNGNLLQDITALDLRQNCISDVSVLARFPNLEKLNLYDNELADIKSLTSCKRLTWLDISDNQITDIMPLSEISTLMCLYALHDPITKVEGSVISGRREYAWGDLHISYHEAINWEALSKTDGLNIKVYDVPEKEQYYFREHGISLFCRSYEDYENERENDPSYGL